MACALARTGRREESALLAREMSRRRYVAPYDRGRVSLVLGDEDRALTLFEEAYRQRSSGLIFLRNSRVSVRNTPRFDSLIGKLRIRG